MAEQIRGIATSAIMQVWTPTGSAGAALVADNDDATYVESSATANTVSGVLNLASAFTIPDGATVNSVKVRMRCRLAATGTRQIRCGFSGTALGTVTNLTSTSFVNVDFDMTNPAGGGWTPAAVNGLTAAYMRAYADTDGPVVHAAYLAIVVDYTGIEPPAPVYTMFAGSSSVKALRAGSTPIVRAMRGDNQVWPGAEATVRMLVNGTSFAPLIELRSGSTATVTWESDGATIGGTVLAPTFSWGAGGDHVVRMRLSDRDAVTTINLGFNHLNDAGTYNIGAGYNRAAQPVTRVGGLHRLTGLRRFLAANGPLAGTLDFTGCTSLEYVECFEADVQQIILTGCGSIIRLCLESCNLAHLDLNPCRASIRDLRAANMQGGLLEFEPLTGSLSNLYHFCTRTQELVNLPGLQLMPVVQQWWVWGCNIVIPGTPISTLLNSCLADNNQLGEHAVDELLVWINGHVPAAGGNVDLSGNAAPSATGAAAAASLVARGGWTVTTASGSGGTPPEEPAGFDATTVTDGLNNRWVFAHQSVGMQVIQGIQAWCDVYSLPDPTLVDVKTGTIPGTGPYLGHWYAGVNGDGMSKITDFNTTIRGGLHAQADIFVLKFCYADLRSTSGYTPAQLFAQYESVMDALRTDYPAKRFLLATETIVMETDEDGPANSLRMTYNNLVRAKYGPTGDLWDIALALSTDPDGNRVRTGTAPNWVEHLYSAYASADQEHISGAASIGRRAAAVPLLQLLAE